MSNTALGVTGTRKDLSTQQYDLMANFLRSWRNRYTHFHHGACVGADEIMATTAYLNKYTIIAHPPIIEEFISEIALSLSDQIMPPAPYLERNHAIVDATSMLLALPLWPEDIVGRSGTWATVRYARKLHRPIVIIYRDGDVVQENMEANIDGR